MIFIVYNGRYLVLYIEESTMANAIAKDRKFAVIASVVLVALGYTILSADCSTGGNCTLARRDWFDWIATTFRR